MSKDKNSKGKNKLDKVHFESSIFDKYRKHIDSVREGYIRGLDYASAMEILRYVQDNTGARLGLSMSCAPCLIQLVEMFTRLENE